jgi:HAD superfamily hydrolase (TIGR01509 family)
MDKFIFLLDLDGTLVNTDEVYFKIWAHILKEYNIFLTHELYNKYIHGCNDHKVIKTLLPNIDVDRISKLKDKLFIENIHDIQIINGMQSFIRGLKNLNHSISIVTNCNRNAAEKIIEFCDISQHIDHIIVGNECARPKPYPDPYLMAKSKYEDSKRVIIFEDSKTGILSARLSNPLCIVGITTNYSEKELMNNGANIVINDYSAIDLNAILSYNNSSFEHLKDDIINSLNLDIINITFNEKLKGGYISDVIAAKLQTKKGILECVIKLENKNETKLSTMAKKLALYDRENYFYNNVSKYVNIRVPLCYGLIKNSNLETIGILMENLNVQNYKPNLNLNKEDINISLQIIANLAKFHSKFWNKNLKNSFGELKKHSDSLFNPTWDNIIKENWQLFVDNWRGILTENQLVIAEKIKNSFQKTQEHLSHNNLTLIHGDVKSPNIFYDMDNNYEPIFLDWQYVAIGKGVQDIVFFLIESFDIENIRLNYPIFKNYYYRKLMENGVTYPYDEYENDLKNALCYFPFFVAIWFGTTPEDDLIDKNFPFFFIQKFFIFIELLENNST